MATLPNNRKRPRDIFVASATQGDYLKDIPKSSSGKYVAMLTELYILDKDEVAPEDQSWTVEFELIPIEWMSLFFDISNPLSSRNKERRQASSPPVSFLMVENQKSTDIAAAFGAKKLDQIKEGGWYVINFNGGPGAIDANWSGNTTVGGEENTDLTSDEVPPFLIVGTIILGLLLWLFQEWCTVKGFFSQAHVAYALNTDISGIGVMDVGTGSCNLLYNHAGLPIAYYDVGVPTWPYNTNTANGGGAGPIYNPGPDLIGNPFVILSHWDRDHYGMAIHSANSAALRGLPWLVPGGIATPAGLVFVNLLKVTAAALVIWPPAFPAIHTHNISLMRCTGASRNDSGLAMIVDIVAAGVAPANMVNVGKALLTGDAMFQYVPLPPLPNLRWLVAAHHGSRTGLAPATTIPLPQLPAPTPVGTNGNIAYSYGIKPGGAHVYNHPNGLAVGMYQARGWTVEACTAEATPNVAGARGNILMCNNVSVQHAHNSPFNTFPKTLF